ncbi:TetR/AcrR family transcriptional regulator [Streptomyces wuyuanensis]|uniref:Regulatory protein, tetR family n=1 Tax=Streptomyces wuyuanensis TaxID=1196353 RepID=A0A1G9TPU6_9ACTN|nr:TetR/AcrR family transcriptional regulator [Streptomyces wuyuanensis]SDM49558.1 regulatory protein, tetR family [Streptomyces wuyuanensis]
MPRPRSLTHDRLASAALAVIDRDGLAALSMRTVAKELGVSTMALYRYVRDREELERLVVDAVLDGLDAEPPPSDMPWDRRVEAMVRRLRDSVSAHPAAVPLTVTHRHRAPGALRWSETVLAILTEAGFRGDRRVIALRALLAYVIGALQLEHLGPLAGEGTAVISDLGQADFPQLSATARRARHITDEQEFFGGLTALLRGLRP